MPVAGDPVRVAFRKWNGTLHWHGPAEVLGTDGHGTWLGVRPGAVWRLGADAPPQPLRGTVFLVPPGAAWWLASFPLDDPREDVYVDVVTATEWRGPELRLIDLDLDVLRSVDGVTRLLDEDEFDEHRELMAYPDDVVDRARAVAARLVLDVDARREPFGDASATWRDRWAAGS